MRTLAISLLGVTMALVLVGCGGGDGCCCDGPTRTHDWLIYLTIGEVPTHVTEYPVFVRVDVRVVHAETGQPFPSGMLVTLSVTPGSFEGAGDRIEMHTANGRLEAIVQVDEAGLYTVTVELPSESITADASFSVGP